MSFTASTLQIRPGKELCAIFQIGVITDSGSHKIFMQNIPFGFLKRTFVYSAIHRDDSDFNLYITKESDWVNRIGFIPWNEDCGIVLVISDVKNQVFLFVRNLDVAWKLHTDYIKIATYISNSLGLNEYIVDIEGIITTNDDVSFKKDRKSVFKTNEKDEFIPTFQIVLKSNIPVSLVKNLIISSTYH